MLSGIFKTAWSILKIFLWLMVPLVIVSLIFAALCFVWFLIYRYYFKLELPSLGQVRQKKPSLLRQLFYEVPRRYVRDMFDREPGYFYPKGIHIFCGEQGSGKTIGIAEYIMRLQTQYPLCKTITNFGLITEDTELKRWQQLLDYNNGHKGVIVGIDEIQNWFMSGLNKLPEQMLEVATQNRKNNRIIFCTSQVFTRVNKGLREQVTMVYNPHTFFHCFTVVVKRKPVFDDEGNVIDMKYRGMYSFVHTEELRNSYDTYKVIHTLAKEGFKDMPVQSVTNLYLAADGKRR